jgi:isoleucyl-tRNA synthetase
MLANIDDLVTIVEPSKMGVLDKWILNKAAVVFEQAHKSFSEYNFVHGMSLLNNFVVNELSGIYIDVTKDRLYCDGLNDDHRRSSQSAMAMITKTMLTLIAPILTYTADEIVEVAPVVIRGDKSDIFEFVYEPLQKVELDFNEEYMISARDSFYEIVDTLKKEKKNKKHTRAEYCYKL